MEQAFEWEEISYDFYPYYWGSKEDWPSLYQSSSDDAQFRAFLQSGMARVVVTVKPGFEDAVNFYMSTGKIWNGGEVPVIGNPMFLSVVDEMKETTGTPQGKYWITTIPTSLLILYKTRCAKSPDFEHFYLSSFIYFQNSSISFYHCSKLQTLRSGASLAACSAASLPIPAAKDFYHILIFHIIR